jgi:hypothetical protein
LYTCSTKTGKYLLSLTTRYIIVGVKMKSKEFLITTAMIVLITYTLSLSLVSQAFPAQQATKTLSSAGTIQIQTTAGLGVYSNSQCTTALSALSWGTLTNGENKTTTVYIKNEGNSPATLSLETSNWYPTSASTYLTLSWNYNNQPINPSQVVQVTLTLSVSPNIQGITNFSFDVTIVGSV